MLRIYIKIYIKLYRESSVVNNSSNNNDNKSSAIFNRFYLNIQDMQIRWSLNNHFMLYETYKNFL
jgi:hypothetical protein